MLQRARSTGADGQPAAVSAMSPRRAVATQGKDAATISAFAEDLAAHGGDPGKIVRTSSGVSAFIAGVRGHPPNAELTSDGFHIIKKAVRSGR